MIFKSFDFNDINMKSVEDNTSYANSTSIVPKYGFSWISDSNLDFIVSFLPMVAAGLVFYLLVAKPQQDEQARKEQEKQDKLDNLSIGNIVVLSSGIRGSIERIEKKFVYINIAPKVVIEVAKEYIDRVES